MAEMREENKCWPCKGSGVGDGPHGFKGKCGSCWGTGLAYETFQAIRTGAFVTPDDGTHVMVSRTDFEIIISALKDPDSLAKTATALSRCLFIQQNAAAQETE